jgi:heat shock protein HslJ
MAPQQLKRAVLSLPLVVFMTACSVAPTQQSTGLKPAPATGATTAPTPPAQVVLALAGTEWAAFAIDGKVEVVSPKPKLRWLSADKVAGTGGCNGFTGPAVVGAGTLLLGPLASTGRACLSMPGSQEDLFFKALELTRKAKIERDQLVLMDESGKQLARLLKTN